MFWIVLGASFVVFVLLAYTLWAKWGAPWREMDKIVRQVGRGEQPRTFLIGDAREVQRAAVALEEILIRQRALDRQIADQSSEQQAIFSAIGDGLLVVDAEKRVALLNRTFEKWFGIPAHSSGQPVLEVVRDATIEQAVAATFENRQPAQREITVGARHLQMNVVPMGSDNGAVRGAVILFHDISELKRLDEMRRDFVANVSHELRTPLSILRGYIETMLDDPKMPRGEVMRILEVMEQHSKRLGLLANDLLLLAQLESGSSTIQLSEIDLLRFFSDLSRDWEKRVCGKGLHTVVDVSDDCSTVRADEPRLREVFDNLLDNALKHSNPNGEITLRAQRHGNEMALSVSDTGIGISAEDLPRIFERFYRADKARSRELGGTGLGLAIVKHIAQLHGGRVEAESELGKETTVTVFLPTESSASGSLATH
jgi:two-component system phosphate regulon sensor histidine kinase PhoR